MNRSMLRTILTCNTDHKATCRKEGSHIRFMPDKSVFLMSPHLRTIWASAQHMADSFLARLPSLALAIIVFLIFDFASILVSRILCRATQAHRQNLGMVFARLAGATIIPLGFLVAFPIVAPSFQAADLIKILGIGSVAIGFAFQNILQNFLAGLLLLWAEPFRVGDQIKLNNYEGTVEAVQARATTVKTYDGRRVVIPNAELFTNSLRSTQRLTTGAGNMSFQPKSRMTYLRSSLLLLTLLMR